MQSGLSGKWNWEEWGLRSRGGGLVMEKGVLGRDRGIRRKMGGGEGGRGGDRGIGRKRGGEEEEGGVG